jgi:glucosylglycerol-phosphate synthase
MNLVAKEYVAARTDEGGALVLSEFAGAAVELNAAVLTNPFSHRAMVAAVEQALAMQPEERRARMCDMRAKVRRYDIRAWAAEQQHCFEAARLMADGAAATPGKSWSRPEPV